MPAQASYEPSPVEYVRQQVEDYEASGGKTGGTHRGLPVVILATTGTRTGALRKTPLMKVECDGRYALVASSGGLPRAPAWYRNLLADSRVTLQDGARCAGYVARELTAGTPEWTEWWERATAAFPRYAQYRDQLRGTRPVPLILLDPAPEGAS
jgi:deazaflavin-dependent oxidoreductase (nitroreductase family)